MLDLDQVSLRSQQTPVLSYPSAKTFGRRSFSFISPSVLNNIPADIRLSPSLSVFRRKLKTFYYEYRSLRFPLWLIVNNLYCSLVSSWLWPLLFLWTIQSNYHSFFTMLLSWFSRDKSVLNLLFISYIIYQNIKSYAFNYHHTSKRNLLF